MTSLRVLGQHRKEQETALEHLSTGKKVNRASDDPTGVIVAQDMRGRQLGITKRIDAYQRETSRLGATEGGLSVLQDMLHDLSGLVVSGANKGGLGEGEQDAIGQEITGILKGIDHIAVTTMFDGSQVLIGNDVASLGLGGLAEVMAKDPEGAQKMVDDAVDRVSGRRGGIGARLNQIDHEISVLNEEYANNAGVLSQIEDADFARETADLVRSQILEDATLKAIKIQQQQATQVLDLIASVPDRAGVAA